VPCDVATLVIVVVLAIALYWLAQVRPRPNLTALPSAATLLTATEVSEALGRPVRAQPVPYVAPLRVTTTMFRPVDGSGIALLVQTYDSGFARFIRYWYGRGEPLIGTGDRAWANGKRVLASVGDTTVMLTLKRAGGDRRERLPVLLAWAVARMTAQT
jgi:hypothetical protein